MDHSLKGRETVGSYSTSIILPDAGSYQAVFFMDAPRLVHCFSFQVAKALTTDSVPQKKRIDISAIGQHAPLKMGDSVLLTFGAHKENADIPLQSQQFNVAILLSSGIWRQNLTAMSNDLGVIAVQFVPPLPGSYDIYLTPTNKSVTYNKRKFSYEVVR